MRGGCKVLSEELRKAEAQAPANQLKVVMVYCPPGSCRPANCHAWHRHTHHVQLLHQLLFIFKLYFHCQATYFVLWHHV